MKFLESSEILGRAIEFVFGALIVVLGLSIICFMKAMVACDALSG